MIFDHAARREFAHAASGIFVALFAILISVQLIRLLSEAAGGRLAAEAVLALLGFAALRFLSILLSLTLFMAVLLPLSRVYRDSEMVVWFSSGVALTDWFRPVFRFALPIVLAIALLSMFLSPWAVLQSANYRSQIEAKINSLPLSPGVFREVTSGSHAPRVFFVEKVDEKTASFGNIFTSTVQDGRLGVVVASNGQQEIMENGDRFLMLDKGHRYEVEPGTPEFRIMEFERYGVRIEEAKPPEQDDSPRHRLIWKLSKDNAREAGELIWRLGQPIAALMLALLAVPLSFVNPRAAHSTNLILAIAAFALYNNLLSISQAWVARGLFPFWPMFLFPHCLMLLILMLLLYRRIAVFLPDRFSFFRMFQKASAAKATQS
ncbi:MAG: LPS export ABC transporter permease LptF [Zoogloeaceae bacterium]|jgi:lipopolysaccharide export system permease protein|nr:LPS export ABC transporter permease LptF [Zoogloeaceae bacterium]